MNFFKTLLIINIIILALIIPGFIILDKYLSSYSINAETVSYEQEFEDPERVNNKPDDAGLLDSVLDKTYKKLEIDNGCLPSDHKLQWEVIKDNKKVENYTRENPVFFGPASEYNEIDGVTTFRGNNYRNSASFGYADIYEEKLEKVWSVKIGYIDIWTGVGWNGQPSIVKWSDNLKSKMNLYKNKKEKADLKEVIYATLDGNIYFMDLDDGSFTRPQINVGAPLKGSVTVDPRGYPLLYSGQGIDEVNGQKVKIGFRIFSLIDQKLLYFINGLDKSAYRYWGAFDSTPLLHKESDTLFECGENGILYSIKLNTAFDSEKGTISIAPEEVKYRYTAAGKKRMGIENSIAIYKNYSYFVDNDGILQCVDLNTLSPVWVRYVNDDTDSTIALEPSGKSEVSLYTANEVDHQGVDGYCYVRKINALTGKLLWEKKYKCTYSENNGGALASPVIGKNDIENLVIYNIAKAYKTNGSKIIAFDKKTGEEVWVVDLEHYSWSSPVDVYTQEGKSYIIQSDSAGNMYLIEGKSGRILDKLPLGANIEGSPAVYDNMLVVGTRGQRIWGIRLK